MTVTPAASARAIAAWCVYDWANSAFPTVIQTFVFSTYFTMAVAASPAAGTALWGWAMSVSGLAIALLGPVAGAIADHSGRRKPWLGVLSVLCIVATAFLWFTRPQASDVAWALLFVMLANFAFEMGTVFYNAMLADLAPKARVGRISGWAWGTGYAGGLVCLVVALFGLVQAEPPPFGLDPDAAEPVRATALFVALWFAAFAWPLFLFVPDRPSQGRAALAAIRLGLAQLGGTLRHIGQHPNILRFLVARLFYTDGLNTIFAFGGIYAAGTFGMGVAEIIQFGIALNVAAGIGAATFAWIDDHIGGRRTVMIALVAMAGLGVPLLLAESTDVFLPLAVMLGLFMGPAQAASRSLMVRLAPAGLETQMFGLFALSGRITGFVGPALLAWVTFATDSQRLGMATALALLAIGASVLVSVREPGR
ncbi:MAG: MFS transporter [Alphaproteobacteria bacterium]|nr:MFS transporter [Alphaproteobacteria bacterium]